MPDTKVGIKWQIQVRYYSNQNFKFRGEDEKKIIKWTQLWYNVTASIVDLHYSSAQEEPELDVLLEKVILQRMKYEMLEIWFKHNLMLAEI